jgi:PAS domain S-box-containing protein
VLLPRPIRWITFCHHFLFFILLIFELCASLAHGEEQPQVPPLYSAKKILLLYTYGDGLPAYRKANPAFLSIITAGGVSTDNLFFEYLDLQRNNGAEYRQRLADLLRYKHAMHRADLIVTVHTEALHFLLNEGKGLFPDAPVLSYLIVQPELIETKSAGRRILYQPQNLDMRGTLEIALKIFPETRKVFFVIGSAGGDLRLEREAKGVFEPWRDKLEFEYTSDRSIEEILQLVASLPPRSIVIYCNVFADKTGRTFTPLEVGRRVAKAANAPVFCLWDTLLGSGVIGGSLLSFEAEGVHAGNAVLDILSGKTLLTKPVTTIATGKTFLFDWQQLKRWGVSEAKLPKESIFLNRSASFWDQYKRYIIGVIFFMLAQSILIILLLLQIRQRKKAEEELKEYSERLEEKVQQRTADLAESNEQLYRKINERKEAEEALKRKEGELREAQRMAHIGSWYWDAKTDVTTGSGELLRIYGLDPTTQLMPDFKEQRGRCYPVEDWEHVNAAVQRTLETGIGYELDVKAIRNGAPIWITTRGEIMRDADGQIVGLRGTVQDITERKQAEEELHKSRDELESRVQKRTSDLKEANETLRQLSFRLLSAQEEERKRIAGEIHDTLGACLSAIKFKAEGAVQQLGETTAGAPQSLATILPVIQEGIEECRRMQQDLRPSLLDDLGLLATLSWYCRRYQTIYTGIKVELEQTLEESDIPNALKIVIFRVTQEGMNNIAKHSKADLVNLSLGKVDGRIELILKDNGQGFDLNRVLASESTKRGLGLTSMRERTELSGGSFGIKSIMGKGTTIRAKWSI